MREHRSQMSRVVTWKESPQTGPSERGVFKTPPQIFACATPVPGLSPFCAEKHKLDMSGGDILPPPLHITIFILFFHPLLYLYRKYLREIILGVRNQH